MSCIEQLNSNFPHLLLGNLNCEVDIPLSRHMCLCNTWLATIYVQKQNVCDPYSLWRRQWHLGTGFGALNAESASAPDSSNISCLLPMSGMFLRIAGQLHFLQARVLCIGFKPRGPQRKELPFSAMVVKPKRVARSSCTAFHWSPRGYHFQIAARIKTTPFRTSKAQKSACLEYDKLMHMDWDCKCSEGFVLMTST